MSAFAVEKADVWLAFQALIELIEEQVDPHIPISIAAWHKRLTTLAKGNPRATKTYSSTQYKKGLKALAEHLCKVDESGRALAIKMGERKGYNFAAALPLIREQATGGRAWTQIAIELVDKYEKNWRGCQDLRTELEFWPEQFYRARMPWLLYDHFYNHGTNRKGKEKPLPIPPDGWEISQGPVQTLRDMETLILKLKE